MRDFPVTPVLDNFNRADEGPPPSSQWTNQLNGLEVVGNRCAGSAVGVNASYYNATTIVSDAEVYCSISTRPANGEYIILSLFNSVSNNAYAVGFTAGASTDTLAILRYDAGIPTTIASSTIVLNTGDAIGLRRIGNSLFSYHRQNGEWEIISEHYDDNYTSLTNLSIVILNTTTRIDNFGGGVYRELAPGIPSNFQSLGLSLIVSDPLWLATRTFSDRLTTQASQFGFENRSIGGYFSANITINDSQEKIEDWIEYGIGRDIEVFNPYLETIWNGFVNRITATLGNMQFTVGPWLSIGNQIYVTYSTVDSSTSPPAIGVRATTAAANNTDSQALYGIIQKIYSESGMTATQATQKRDAYINDPTRAFPYTSRDSNLSGSGQPSVSLECLGYWNLFEAYYYSNAGTGNQNLSAKIQAIINADPNSVLSTDFSQITSNTTQVNQEENGSKKAMTFIKKLVGQADASGNLYKIGVYADRQTFYEQIPMAVAYQQRTSSNSGIVDEIDSEVKPWDVKPGNWLFYPNFLVGREPPLTNTTLLGTDMRSGLIETMRFDAPYALSVNGIKLSNLDQSLAAQGLAGEA